MKIGADCQIYDDCGLLLSNYSVIFKS